MNIRILACAETEMAEAVDYYNDQFPGIGYEFAAEVKVCLNRICSFPEAWPRFSKSTRRCLLNRFPYGVLYQLKSYEIIIFAVMYLKRDPDKWQEKVDNYLKEHKNQYKAKG